jgi:hypothetical protein
MGLHQPKPFKKLCRLTGKWVTVIPAPVKLNEKNFDKKEYSVSEKKGSRRHPMSFPVLKVELLNPNK